MLRPSCAKPRQEEEAAVCSVGRGQGESRPLTYKPQLQTSRVQLRVYDSGCHLTIIGITVHHLHRLNVNV